MKSNLLVQEQSIEVILIVKVSSKPGALKFGLMVENTKGSGKMAKHVVGVGFGMQTATLIMGSGCRTKLMDMGCIYTQTELNTWASGKTMYNTVGVRKHGQTDRDSKVITKRVRNMVMAPTTGQTDLRLPVVGPTIK